MHLERWGVSRRGGGLEVEHAGDLRFAALGAHIASAGTPGRVVDGKVDE